MGIFLTVIVLVNVGYMIVIGCFLVYHTLREANSRQCRCLNRLMDFFGDEEDDEEVAIEMTNPNVDRQHELSGQPFMFGHFSIEHN